MIKSQSFLISIIFHFDFHSVLNMIVYMKLKNIAMNGLIKKHPIEKNKLLNDAIIKKYFSNWTNIPGLTKNLHS